MKNGTMFLSPIPEKEGPVTMSPKQQRQRRWQRHCSSSDDCLRAALEFYIEFQCRAEAVVVAAAVPLPPPLPLLLW